ncbi:MAG: hypothetical protein QOG23_5753, partial [Blastocatellia bacterium]|nr:hypothetical protein [Blastocatellia bacterium]
MVSPAALSVAYDEMRRPFDLGRIGCR